MAELDIQKKQGGIPWWGWLIGLLLLLVVAWWLIAAMWDYNGARTGTEPYNDGAALPVADVAAAPADFDNRNISGLTTVESVVSDRGFWVSQNGQRMFVVLDQHNEAVDVNAGQRVRLAGEVMRADEARNLPGVQSLEQQTRQILERQGAFLYVDSPQGISIASS